MRFMGRMRLMALLKTRVRHAFPEAALGDEIFFQAAELLVEKIVGLVDETQRDVRHHFGGARGHILAIQFRVFVSRSMHLPTPCRQLLLAGLTLACGSHTHAAIDPGEILIAEMNCAACHEVTPPIAARLASRPSPRLDAAHAVRVTVPWLRAFLEDPQATEPGTLMPDLLGGMDLSARREAADALTHYLVQLRGPEKDTAPLVSDATLIESGKTLYHTVGCVACHAPEEPPAEKMNNADAWADLDKLRQTSVPLGALDLKYSPAELTAFLQDPLKSRPGGRMPSLKLTAPEARAIAAYLLRRPAPAGGKSTDSPALKPLAPDPKFAVDAAKAARGKELFATLNCAACHQLDEPGRKSKPMAGLNARQPTGCLGTKPKAGVPRFEMNDRQRVVILAHLGNQAALAEPLTPEQQITRTMTALNCYACHARERRGGVEGSRREYFAGEIDLGDEGRIPPTLRGVGAKLRPGSIMAVLVAGESMRPYMNTRMPQYGTENVGHLAALFEQTDAQPEAQAAPVNETAALDAFGRQLAGARGLNCISCHNFDGHKSPGIPALDLARAAGRLKWDWFRRFLLDPQSVHSGTRMPVFWPGGVSTNTGILGGDAEKQIRAIWTYLTRKDFAELPAGLGQ